MKRSLEPAEEHRWIEDLQPTLAPYTLIRFMQLFDKPCIAIGIEYSVFAHGGTEVLVRTLLQGLSANYAIVLFSPDANVRGSEVELWIRAHISLLEANTPADLIAKLERERVQLVHFHCGHSFAWNLRDLSSSPIWRALQSNLCCLTTNHGFFSPLEGYCAWYRPFLLKLFLFPRAWIAKTRTLRRLYCEVAVSQFDERELRRWYWPYRGRFRQIYHSQLSESDSSPQASFRVKRIVCVGAFGSRKGQPTLAEAFGQIAESFPEWTLCFIGWVGEQRIWEETQVKIKDLHLEGRVSRQEGLANVEIISLLRTSEIFVMPSRFEGLGLALQEALFQGCACLATRSGGPQDLICDGDNGLLVPKDDPEAMALALSRLMSDEPLRQRFQAQGPRSVLKKRMLRGHMVEAYEGLYKEILRT